MFIWSQNQKAMNQKGIIEGKNTPQIKGEQKIYM